MEALDALIVLTTWPAGTDASGFAATLVEERLAACVSLLPEMDSVYRWQGRVERARERQVVIKTSRPQLEALKLRLRALHPYDLPELLAIPLADGGEEYLAWLAQSTGGQVEGPAEPGRPPQP